MEDTQRITSPIEFLGFHLEGEIPSNGKTVSYLKTEDKEVKDLKLSCLKCGSDKIKKYRLMPRNIIDIPLDGKALIYKLQVRDYKCTKCNKTFRQDVTEKYKNDNGEDVITTLKHKSRTTTRLKAWLTVELESRSLTSIAKEVGVTPTTISNITDSK